MSVKGAIEGLERWALSDLEARANIFWIFLYFTSSHDHEELPSAQPCAQYLYESANATTEVSKCIEMIGRAQRPERIKSNVSMVRTRRRSARESGVSNRANARDRIRTEESEPHHPFDLTGIHRQPVQHLFQVVKCHHFNPQRCTATREALIVWSK
jgi:hypothetical protein